MQFRAATYNVHSYVGRDGIHDPGRVSEVIGELGADVVGLQEFIYPGDVTLDTRAPVVLTSLDHYQCALGPARLTRAHHFGNALLTRHPLLEVHRLDLSMARREARSALAATIDVGGLTVHVLVAHLGLRVAERRFQVAQILDYLGTVRYTRLVVLGDFNDWLPGRSVARVLDARLGPLPRPRSFPARYPVVALDRVWVHPRHAFRHIATHASPAARRASDHLPVVADIEW